MYFDYGAKCLFTCIYCIDKYVEKMGDDTMKFSMLLPMAAMSLSTNLAGSPINIKRIIKRYESDQTIQQIREMEIRIRSVLEIQVREGWL